MGKVAEAKSFIDESTQEMKKVTWPTKQQTISTTWVVIIVTSIIAAFLGFADFLLSKLVHYVLSL